MDEIRENNNSFVLSNNSSIKSLYLTLAMMLVLLSFHIMSIFYDVSTIVKVISLMTFLILAFFRIREVFRSTIIIVENTRLIIGITEIRASEVEEIVYNSWIIYIKCKNRRRLKKFVTISLRNNKELEHLKSILNEFGKSNDIRIRQEF